MSRTEILSGVLAAGILGCAGQASAASYVFFSGGAGYTGPYNGAGTVYDQIKSEAITCPTANPGCSGSSDQTSQPLVFDDFTASASGGTNVYVNEDLAPAWGGMGVDGDGDDQINGSNALTLTFNHSTTITGIATLFANGHQGFGGGFGTSIPTEAQLDAEGILINSVFHNFKDINEGKLAITGTTFVFTSAGKVNVSEPVQYYISGITTVPVPAAA